MFSKEAQELAKPTVEAIKKIAERQERECPECKGKGSNITDYPGVHCPTCDGTRKIKGKWEWEPEKWELVIYKDKVDVITGHSKSPIHIHLSSARGICTKELIPLLHWESIEKILREYGYVILFDSGFRFRAEIYKLSDYKHPRSDGPLHPESAATAEIRQLAVMKSVKEMR